MKASELKQGEHVLVSSSKEWKKYQHDHSRARVLDTQPWSIGYVGRQDPGTVEHDLGGGIVVELRGSYRRANAWMSKRFGGTPGVLVEWLNRDGNPRHEDALKIRRKYDLVPLQHIRGEWGAASKVSGEVVKEQNEFQRKSELAKKEHRDRFKKVSGELNKLVPGLRIYAGEYTTECALGAGDLDRIVSELSRTTVCPYCDKEHLK